MFNQAGRKTQNPGQALHLSTADHPLVGYQPWLNIGSARWLRFGSARTLHSEPGGQYYPIAPANAGSFNYTTWFGAARFLITGRNVEEVLREVCEVQRASR